ncbi:uncharacterized protein LOC134836259 [Culicoides brevitarsis]|uniref:uncharacterized protein LOC134836259 n=1 Tax=Culicoides brevitarsis TaxID=469753 RepID=UPI00307B65B4
MNPNKFTDMPFMNAVRKTNDRNRNYAIGGNQLHPRADASIPGILSYRPKAVERDFGLSIPKCPFDPIPTIPITRINQAGSSMLPAKPLDPTKPIYLDTIPKCSSFEKNVTRDYSQNIPVITRKDVPKPQQYIELEDFNPRAEGNLTKTPKYFKEPRKDNTKKYMSSGVLNNESKFPTRQDLEKTAIITEPFASLIIICCKRMNDWKYQWMLRFFDNDPSSEDEHDLIYEWSLNNPEFKKYVSYEKADYIFLLLSHLFKLSDNETWRLFFQINYTTDDINNTQVLWDYKYKIANDIIEEVIKPKRSDRKLIPILHKYIRDMYSIN